MNFSCNVFALLHQVQETKQVKTCKISQGRKNDTRSVSTRSVRKKGILVAEISELKTVRGRRGGPGGPDDADQMVKADLLWKGPTET